MSSIRRRGVLVLLTGTLKQYPYNAEHFQQMERALRKRKRHSELLPQSINIEKEYNPSESEWTIFFIGQATNPNSIRFRSILVEFCHSHRDKVQCIFISNGDNCNDDERYAYGTDFHLLQWDHPNRSSLLQVLGITRVPTAVIVSNSNGRRITDHGMAAIEYNHASQLFERWRKNESGLNHVQWFYESSCNII